MGTSSMKDVQDHKGASPHWTGWCWSAVQIADNSLPISNVLTVADIWSSHFLAALEDSSYKAPLKYGLSWMKFSSQRWSQSSTLDHLLASYVTPTNWSDAFFVDSKTPNFKPIGKSQFWKGLFPIISKLGVFKMFKKAKGLLVGVT